MELSEVPRDVLENLLRTVLWYNHGDRDASVCRVYYYDDEVEHNRVLQNMEITRDNLRGCYIITMDFGEASSGNKPLTRLDEEY